MAKGAQRAEDTLQRLRVAVGEEGKKAQQQYRHAINEANGNSNSRLMDRLIKILDRKARDEE